MMRGDLLFYKGDGSLASRLIQWRTKGPFIHVEVDLGDGTAIGATWQSGVTRHPVDYSHAVTYTLDTPAERLEAGIAFLQGCLGDAYSWSDILNQIFTLVLPSPVILSQPHAFDCSELTTRYIDIAGGLSSHALHNLLETPQLVTPNDLARAAGLC